MQLNEQFDFIIIRPNITERERKKITSECTL